MNSTSNTLERIQNEIQESLQRERELRNGNSKHNEVSSKHEEVPHTLTNGISKLKLNYENDKTDDQTRTKLSPYKDKQTVSNGVSNSNGFTRRFIPNTKGVMQNFFKNRGKVGSSMNSIPQQNGFSPARFRVEKGQTPRNGFVPAEEKIVKELLDFQVRENELRSERMKSQPDLMAALELEEAEMNCRSNGVLKSARSMTNLYQSEDTSKSLPSR